MFCSSLLWTSHDAASCFSQTTSSWTIYCKQRITLQQMFFNACKCTGEKSKFLWPQCNAMERPQHLLNDHPIVKWKHTVLSLMSFFSQGRSMCGKIDVGEETGQYAMSNIFNLWLTFLNQKRLEWLGWYHLVAGSSQNNLNQTGNTIHNDTTSGDVSFWTDLRLSLILFLDNIFLHFKVTHGNKWILCWRLGSL